MATSWIDIVDSAVKIGLGAAIAGAVSLLAPFALFAKEVYIDKRQRRLRLLEEAVTSLEAYSSFVAARAAATCDFWKATLRKNVPDHMKARLDKILSEIDVKSAERNRAIGRLDLLGHHDIASRVRELGDRAFEMTRGIFEAKEPAEAQKRLEEIQSFMTPARREILKQIGRLYADEPELKKISRVDFDVN